MAPIDGRDRAVVSLVARFKQLSAQQIRLALFTDTRSNTPSDRTLRRLTDDHYLSRIERRIVGGARGGSGQYVYQLGRKGFYMFFTGSFSPVRTVNYHCLAVGDCYNMLRAAEREGTLAIVGLSTEPDCHRTIGGVQLKPDMHIDVQKVGGQRTQLWLEVDMATEGQKQLKGKLENYWRAYNDANVADTPVFPKIVWVAVDDERAKELKWLIEQGPAEAQMLFTVTSLSRLPELLA